ACRSERRVWETRPTINVPCHSGPRLHEGKLRPESSIVGWNKHSGSTIALNFRWMRFASSTLQSGLRSAYLQVRGISWSEDVIDCPPLEGVARSDGGGMIV